MILLSLLAVIGCGKPSPDDKYVRPDVVTDFDVLFNRSCTGCHGKDGHFGPAPPLDDAIFQSILSDDELLSLVTSGREGTQMPAFDETQGGKLTTEQVKALVAGVRKEWAGQKPTIQDLPAYSVSKDDPAGLASANVEAGQKVFAAVCSDCHGEHGEGGETGAINSNAFGRLISDQLLRRIVITGREDLGMPNFADSGKDSSLGRPLKEQEIIDVVAYVRKLQHALPVKRDSENDTASKDKTAKASDDSASQDDTAKKKGAAPDDDASKSSSKDDTADPTSESSTSSSEAKN